MAVRLFFAFALLVCSFKGRAGGADPFVVHEWGTFTSVQGADGVQLSWAPLIDTELPLFVYRCYVDNGGFRGPTLLAGGNKGTLTGTLRMETPVIYFYSETEREVDVRVRFPEGLITEWYPQASIVGPYLPDGGGLTEDSRRALIEWNRLKVLARDTKEISPAALIREEANRSVDHFYAARETDANFLRVRSGDTSHEYDRDLFYRGVGHLDAPLIVSMEAGERLLTLSTNSAEPMAHVFVVTLRRGLMRYQKVEHVTRTTSTDVDLNVEAFAAQRDVGEKLMRDVAVALVEEGLYEKEARAMVATWKDQWFGEDGTRVLYVLPRSWTDRNLPLDISPAPDRIVRVMVGRSELITPTQQRELTRQILSYVEGDAITKQRAMAAASALELGRFLMPAAQLALGAKPSAERWRAAQQFVIDVHAQDAAALQLTQAAR